MKSKEQVYRDEMRFLAAKNDYFQKIRAYRLALSQPASFNQKTLLMLLNNAEVAYKRVGFHFGDDRDKGYL